MLTVVLGTVGILCVPIGLFIALRIVASFPKPGPVRLAISVPQRATLTRVSPQPITPRQLELTAGSDGVFR